VLVAGSLSIALALAAEFLMRSAPVPDPSNPSAATGPNLAWLGSVLMAFAVLLVGVVAWVNDGLPIRRTRAATISPAAEGEPGAPIQSRAIRSVHTQPTAAALPTRRSLTVTLQLALLRYSVWRTRVGWYGTTGGLLIALVLCVWLALILKADWRDPLAGWVWLAIMLVLLLTFVGVRPWPAGASLIAHDPAEPAFEPPVARAEWIILAIIMVAAVILRFWHLDSIPAGPYIDESGRALDARNLNYGLPVNRETFVFFGTGWWGVPSFYFWLVAQSMKVFGDNLLGARVVHALAGVGTVWFTYRIGRVVWSPRVALIAAALIAVSDLAIQASRTAGESTITLFCWTACFYYLLKALKGRLPVDFVLAGLAGGFSLLGYASGKLLPLFLLPAAAYILLRWGFTGMRRYLPGLALMALAAAVVCGPNLVFQFTQKPGAMTERYNSVTIFTNDRKAQLADQYHTDNLGLILAGQYVAAYSAYDVGKERGPFYPTGQPVLPIPWAALWVLGTAYMVWRLGDARYAILGVWLLAALGGSAFTIDTPTLQRALMVVPLLALLPAIFLDRVATGAAGSGRWAAGRIVVSGRWKIGNLLPTAHRPLPTILAYALIAAFILLSAFQVLTYYFGPYTAKALYSEFDLAGQYMEGLDPKHDVVYDNGLPVMFGDPSPLLFLGNHITRHDLGNAPDALPVTDNNGKDVHFMVSPPDDPLMGLLKSYYPGGTAITLSKPDGTPVVAVYHVTAAEINGERIMTARYLMPNGAFFEQQEPKLGTYMASEGQSEVSPPQGITYPTTAIWLGGLISPAYGTYRMELQAPTGGTLELDGKQVLTATANMPPQEARIVLSRGVHTLRLQARLDSAAALVQLLWGTDNGAMVPVGQEFLWGGPQGALGGQVYNQPNGQNWLLPDQLPQVAGRAVQLRNDGTFSWANINASLQAGLGAFVDWRGTLIAPTDGNYYFEAITPGMVTIRIDGKLVGSSNVPGGPNLWPVNTPLTAGSHQFEMRYYATQDGSPFHLYWQPPGQARTILTSAALAPADSGAWQESEMPSPPSPDNAVIHALEQKSVEVTASLPANGWVEATGIAVLPDGHYAVGDSGNHKLMVYDVSGKQQAVWGGTTAGADTFNDVSDLTVGPGGTIAALDAENADIRVFNEDGKQIKRLPASQLNVTHARGITCGPDGKYYVADTAGSRVVRVSQDGSVEQVFQKGNASIQDLDQPVDVAVGPDGSVYVGDLRDRIVMFDRSGQAKRQWNISVGRKNGGSKLALWDGLVMTSDPDNNTIAALDPRRGTLLRLSAIGNSPLQLNTPLGLAMGPNDRLYVVDSDGKRVIVLGQAPSGP
jgi:4-amino-4-deoxy-L-arabinose transferase-like glycosyltransferase/DNA-binding beta-propeller fold protein YncE